VTEKKYKEILMLLKSLFEMFFLTILLLKLLPHLRKSFFNEISFTRVETMLFSISLLGLKLIKMRPFCYLIDGQYNLG
jgi:hypothetical protein